MYAAISGVSMMTSGRLAVIFVLALLGQALSVPAGWRPTRGVVNNELDSGDVAPAGMAYRDLVSIVY